jgi:hypothetical protein
MSYMKYAVQMHPSDELGGYGLPFNHSTGAGTAAGALKLPVMLMDESGDHFVLDIRAMPAANGYYQALIPLGEAHYSAAIEMGHLAELVQIADASFQEADGTRETGAKQEEHPAALLFEEMEEVGAGLHRCSGEEAFILVPRPSAVMPGKMLVLSFLFRPLIRRRSPSGRARAA